MLVGPREHVADWFGTIADGPKSAPTNGEATDQWIEESDLEEVGFEQPSGTGTGPRLIN